MILAYLAMLWFGNPSNKLIVIGVTGTNGKSTTVRLISDVLERTGHQVGALSTIEIKLPGQTKLNNLKMTMPGRFYIQKFLKNLVNKGGRYAVIETSSQGIQQYRHLGINYDVAVFTNLTPEHIESHGSFAKYQKAKSKLFSHLTKRKKKKINGEIINKKIIVNFDDKQANFFLQFPADQKITYGLNSGADIYAQKISLTPEQTEFYLADTFFSSKLIGKYNLYNLLATIATTKALDIDTEVIKHAIFNPKQIPGRLEFIVNDKGFEVLIDYAPEPESMRQLYETLKLFDKKRIIHVLGSAGGGRDKSRRPILGQIAIQNADIIIITNEDPYDEDPQTIIDQVAKGAKDYLKKLSAQETLKNSDHGPELPRIYKILDREQAIKKALALAEQEDLILITGKGCEQAICITDGKKIPWDDRAVVKNLLKDTNK